MRLETPHASGYFVNTDPVEGPHTVAGARRLWDAFCAATGTNSALKSGDWVLDDPSELSGEFVAGTWTLTADHQGTRDFVRIESNDGVLRFYGSATPLAHHALGKLWESLRSYGYTRFESYGDALRGREKSKPRRSLTGVRGRNAARRAGFEPGQHVHDRVQSRLRLTRSIWVGCSETFGQFRNMMAIGFAVSVFTGTEVLRVAVVAAVVTTLVSAGMITSFEYRSAQTRAGN
jgi:hypothetical protein